jgi:hypothetical protein
MDFRFELRGAENVQKHLLYDIPMGFWRRSFSKDIFIAPFWGFFQLSIAPMDIIICGPAFWWDFCLFTAHLATTPVRPLQ